MGIGVGIFLIALGAILTFAVHWHLAGVDLRVVGWVLMFAGAAGVILFFAFWNRRNAAGRVVTDRQVYREAGPAAPYAEPRAYQSERRVYEDPPPPPGV